MELLVRVRLPVVTQETKSSFLARDDFVILELLYRESKAGDAKASRRGSGNFQQEIIRDRLPVVTQRIIYLKGVGKLLILV